MTEQFDDALRSAINSHSKENGSNTPDFILADFLSACLRAFDAAVVRRAEHYGRMDQPGQGILLGGRGGCAPCYRKTRGVDCKKVGTFCHRCGSAEELT
jgi:hypothetical protein